MNGGPKDSELDRGPRPRRWGPVLAVAIVALQLAVVVTAFVPAPHNGGDNAGYITLATSLLDGSYTDLWESTAPPHTKYPPVFPAVLAGLVALGATTWTALKAVPAVFTILAVLLVYVWAAGRRGPFFGAGVAALTGLSAAVVWSSHWILSDPPFLAFTLLALWALDRAQGVAVGSGSGAANGAGPSGGGGADGSEAFDGGAAGRTERESALSLPWWALGIAAALLAYFTRSAGLPLLLALGLWLGLRRRWTYLGVSALVAGAPVLAWWLRARGTGEVQYMNEFWMVDPYDPALGTVAVGGLVERAVENAQGYVTTWIPEGLVGPGGAWVGLLGVVLLVAAGIGWARRMGRRPTVTELFTPLYAGVILLWPEVWSGDRFALPLFPLVLFYGGEAVEWAAGLWSRRAVRPALALAAAVVVVPALQGLSNSVRGARECASVMRLEGTWACYGPAWGDFAEAARWTGANLPPGSAVLTRKPRLFYVEGGVPGRTYPFSVEPETFLAEAEAAGARYVLLDQVDGRTMQYVGAVIQRQPSAFCSVRSFSSGGAPPTRLLGLVPDTDLGGSMVEREGRMAAAFPPCPPELLPRMERTPAPLELGEIPRLVGG